MKPSYIIERFPDGWLVCAPEEERGIPLDAIREFTPFFSKSSGMDMGIAHHYKPRRAIFAITESKEDNAKWREAIALVVANLEPLARWWRGCDVGSSSAAMFAALVPVVHLHRREADDMGRGSVPLDASDFGRCARLLAAIPEFRADLAKVATAYPETKWPAIIARWDEIEAATPEEQSRILSSL